MMITMLAGWIFTMVMVAGGLSLCAAENKAEPAVDAKKAVKVTVQTSAGDIHLELYPDKAPKSVENFISYVKSGNYDNTIFHRVIPGFMIQGGGFTANMDQKPTQAPIVNEAANGLLNKKGTIAMARTMEVNSATSQFFINLVDNGFLDYKDSSPSGFGYCVFGKVIKGMDVVEKIGKAKTGTKGPFRDVPIETITITHVTIE